MPALLEAGPAIRIRKEETYLHFLTSLRGFVIVQIVLLHASSQAFYSHTSATKLTSWVWLYNVMMQVGFHSATLYFTILSGILYLIVFSKRKISSFYSSRLKYVILPYVILTTLYTIHNSCFSSEKCFGEVGGPNFFEQILRNLLLGSAEFHLWYIPVLAVLFAISPALAYFVQVKRTRYFLVILAFMPVVVSRSGTAFSVETIVYFLGAYALGMWIGANFSASMDGIARWIYYITTTAAVSTILLLLFYASGTDVFGFTSLRETAFYIQRLSIFMVMMHIFRHHESYLSKIETLNDISVKSFAVYLLHVPVMELSSIAVESAVSPASRYYMIFSIPFYLFFGVIGPLIIVGLVRLVAGRRSKFIVGC